MNLPSKKRVRAVELLTRPSGWLRRDPYKVWEKRAENIKARVQMVIAFLLVIALALRAVSGLAYFIGHPVLIAVHQHRPLELVSLGLMYAAGVELAYMLFTPGPDEAIAPVILGLSSTILLIVSDGSENWKDAIIVPLLTASVAGLFLVRERYEKQSEKIKAREAKLKLREQRSEQHGVDAPVFDSIGPESAYP
ncbi:hypothetical protein [Sphingomonas sp. Leaf28]|uniref:hypothetical protein n=1 Tax=Sphingomonas sp. Leaf28 TaxID=1735695 RepID=UPI0012E2EB9D|nr:hypothetical protein [Sphingomonas sp. Leaf28]